MNGIFGVISAKFCIFDIASFFAIPPNSASYGLLEEFLFIFQRYKIYTTLTNNLLERCQHFTTVPKVGRNIVVCLLTICIYYFLMVQIIKSIIINIRFQILDTPNLALQIQGYLFHQNILEYYYI